MVRTVENFKISLFQKGLSEHFIDKYKDDLDWSFILQNIQLSESFIKGHYNYIDWEQIGHQKNLSEEFIIFFVKDKIGAIRTVSQFKLSEKALKSIIEPIKYKNENPYAFDSIMRCIIRNQKLSEYFIEKYYDKLYLSFILKFQKVSEHFLERHWSDIITEDEDDNYIEDMVINQKLSESFIMKHYDEIGWNNILQYQQLSESFIQKLIDNKIISLRG